MSILSSVKTYLQSYIDSVDANKPLWVNFLKEEPVSYSIVPLGTQKKVTQYIHGRNKGTRQFVFAFQSNRFTADEAERIGNIELFETLSEWMDDQTEADNLPTITGKNVLSIEAIQDAYLFEQGESSTGIYQIQCMLEYSTQ